MMDTSLLFKAFIMFPNQDIISSLLEPYKGKASVLKVILWKFPKRPMCFKLNVSAMYIVAKFGGYSW